MSINQRIRAFTTKRTTMPNIHPKIRQPTSKALNSQDRSKDESIPTISLHKKLINPIFPLAIANPKIQFSEDSWPIAK